MNRRVGNLLIGKCVSSPLMHDACDGMNFE